MYTHKLVGFLAFNVARWIVAANCKHPIIVALNPSTPHRGGVFPNDLRIVAAFVDFLAGVGVVVVVRLLRQPELDSVATFDVFISGGQVLAVGPHGVLQFAVFHPRLGVVVGVLHQGLVPRQRWHADLLPSHIVGLQPLFRGALCMPTHNVTCRVWEHIRKIANNSFSLPLKARVNH